MYFSILSTLVHLPILYSMVDQYPWGGSSEGRNKELLDLLRRNTRLEVYQESIPSSMLDSNVNGLQYKNLNGDIYIVKVYDEKHISRRLKESELPFMNPKIIDQKLNNTCVLLSNAYWNYEWCYQKEVRQFHIQGESMLPTDTPNQIMKIGMRDPDWSLGKYTYTEVFREGGDHDDEEAKIEVIVQNFQDGQHCDETGAGRKCTVRIKYFCNRYDAIFHVISLK